MKIIGGLKKLIKSVFRFNLKVAKNTAIFSFMLLCPLLWSKVGFADSTDTSSAHNLYLSFSKLLGNETGISHSSVSTLASDMLLVLIQYVVMMSCYITLILFCYFGLKAGLNTAAVAYKKGNKAKELQQLAENQSLKFLGLLFFFLSTIPSPYTSTEHRLSNGAIVYKPIYQSIGETVFLSVIESTEKFAETNMEVEHLVKDFEVKKKTYLEADFRDFSIAYMQSGSSNSTSHFNIVETDRLYKVEFQMGPNYYTYKFNKDLDKHKRAAELGFDIKQYEWKFINDYMNALATHAYKLKKSVQNTQIFGNSIYTTYVSKRDKKQFNKSYEVYCDSIYEPHDSMSKSEFNSLIFLSAKCASKDFMIKAYDNQYWSYLDTTSGMTDLNTNYAMHFGLENQSMSIDEMISETKELCKEGFLACEEAVDFVSNEYVKSNTKLGLATPFTKHIADFFDISFKTSGLLSSRTFEVSDAKTDEIKEATILDAVTESVSRVDFNTLPTNFSKYIDFAMTDIQDLDIPTDFEEVVKMGIGSKPIMWIDRFSTCMRYPDQIKNGYRCLQRHTEMTKFSIDGLQEGVKIIITSKLFDSLFSPKNKAKQADVEVGTKMSKKILGLTGVGIALSTYFTDYSVTDVFSNYETDTFVGTMIVKTVGYAIGLDTSFIHIYAMSLIMPALIMAFYGIMPIWLVIKAFVTYSVQLFLNLVVFPCIRIPILIKDYGLLEGFGVFVEENYKTILLMFLSVSFMHNLEAMLNLNLGFLVVAVTDIFMIEVNSMTDLLLNAMNLCFSFIIMIYILNQVLENFFDKTLKIVEQ
ncbi:hypothetical protein OTK51_13245 [Vibrio scophthalmi]|uniref:hypothetical protein n=1 Tax=Vibrio scophthalmi TaxID=45658 RepID=UPI00228395DC|nr:hypothetical protein [Vibrio scophthalmi]MCY9804393.1 hypothetical protein [Vibrio scophthalmi]